MKLRYLRLARQRPPLQNLALTFPQDPLLSAQPLALRFIVGLNGSGKTTLLQALAEIFTCLDRDGQPPTYPLWLAYDLEIENQPRTVYLSAPNVHGQDPTLVIFENPLPESTDWDELTPSDERIWRRFAGGMPGIGELGLYLPGALLVYTSGHTAEWENIFAPHPIPLDEGDAIPPTPDDERPLGWDVARENERNRQLGEDQPPLTALPAETLASQLIYPSKSFFVGPLQLTLASLLVTLKHLAEAGQNDSLQAIYRELRLPWQAPLAISFSVNLERLDANRAVQLADLLKLASRIVREPEPGTWRHLIFELPGRAPKKTYNANIDETDTTVRALLKVLGGEDSEIFDAFKTLSGWQQNNFVRDVRLVLKKEEVKDVLLLDWLSDGERMLLGRVSLFYLLRDKHNATQRNALLILDEPETHFNDKWKRRLVNMLDDALRDSAHQVVISTHSSILLTDVFNTEISILKNGEVDEPRVGTFGSLPSEIMRDIFDTENPIGDRAKTFLDAVLVLVEHPDLANGLWRALEKNPNPDVGAWIKPPHPFGAIIQLFARSKNLQQRTPEQWLRLFQGLHRRASVNTDGPVTLASVLKMLFNYVGGGYYQFELRRQHRRLTEAGENAPPR